MEPTVSPSSACGTILLSLSSHLSRDMLGRPVNFGLMSIFWGSSLPFPLGKLPLNYRHIGYHPAVCLAETYS